MSKKVHEVPHIPALSRCEPVSPRNTRKSSLKDTERKRKKLEKMRNSPKGDQKYLKSFVSFRVFREIRVRTRLLPFASFFSVCFCVSSAFSVVRSEPGSVRTFRKSLSFYCLHLCGCGKGTCVHSRAAHSFWYTVSGTQFGVSPFLEIRVGSFLGPPVVIFFKSCIIAVDVFSRMCPVRSFDPVVSH